MCQGTEYRLYFCVSLYLCVGDRLAKGKSMARYLYALDKDNKIVGVQDSSKESYYKCPHCQDEMRPRQGSKRAWHFAHKRVECSYSNYLHTLACIKICDWFNSASEVLVELPAKIYCPSKENCLFFNEMGGCTSREIKSYNLKKYYNTATRERDYGNFRVDILLGSEELEAREPIFLEIYVTHKCSEEKLRSGIRIIEFSIKSEEDIENIIKAPIRRSHLVAFHNFKQIELSEYRDEFEVPLVRQHLTHSMKIYTEYKTTCRSITAPNNLMSLVVTCRYESRLYEAGGSYKVSAALFYNQYPQLRHCAICKYQKYNEYERSAICTCYKKNGMNKECKYNDANQCSFFLVNREYIKYALSVLSSIPYLIERDDSKM